MNNILKINCLSIELKVDVFHFIFYFCIAHVFNYVLNVRRLCAAKEYQCCYDVLVLCISRLGPPKGAVLDVLVSQVLDDPCQVVDLIWLI